MTNLSFFCRAPRALAIALTAGLLAGAPPAAPQEPGDIVPWRDLVKQLAGERGVAVLPTIAFEFDSDRLTARAQEQVANLARALKVPAFDRSVFSVEGHTDSAGSAAYNDDLSLRRARRVVRSLVEEHGVRADKLRARGRGERAPRDGFAPEDGRNRRVEIVNVTASGDGADAAPVAAPEVRIPPPVLIPPPVVIPPPVLASDEPGGARGGAPARRALLVGVDAYENVKSLKGAVADARAMQDFLVARAGYRPEEVRLLLDGEATRNGILAAARDWLVAGTAPGDEAFLFFSGHGFQQPDGADRDESDGMDETLVPVDASVDGNGVVHGMIVDDELAALLDELAGRQVRVVVDACHSGTTFRTADADWRFVKTPRLKDGSPALFPPATGVAPAPGAPAPGAPLADGRRDVTFWTAVQAHQQALVSREAAPGEAGSVFTRALLRGARDGHADSDGDGVATAAELHRYVTDESKSYCERYPGDCGVGLEPQLVAAQERMTAPAFGALAAADTANDTATATLVKDLLVRPARARRGEAGAGGAGGLRLSMSPTARLAFGDEMTFTVESDRDGALLLLDVDAAGQLVQIFPNEFADAGRSGRIRAGDRLSLPGPDDWFRFRAAPPLGRGLLVAVLSDGSARLSDLASRHKDLSVVPRPEAYVADIGEALRAAGGEGGGWSVATLAYEIVAP